MSFPHDPSAQEAVPTSEQEISAATPPRSGTVWTGRFGLRAGWSLLIFLLLTVLCSIVFSFGLLAAQGKLGATIAKMKHPPAASASHDGKPAAKPAPKPSQGIAAGEALMGESVQLAGLAVATWLMCRIERRRFGVFGIGLYRIRDILPGAFWGLVLLSALVFTLKSAHLLVFDARLLFGRAMFVYGLKWLALFFIVGCFEEFLFRGYLQFTLTRGLFGLGEKVSARHARAAAFLLASVLTSLLFFKAHTGNEGETAWGLFAVFVAGVAFTYALWRTGSLWWGIGFHMAWDWAQSFLYGVPDSGNVSVGRLFQTHAVGRVQWSGGSDGPEGSVLVIPTLLLVIVVLRFFTRPGVQPELEQLPREPRAAAAPATVA
jgi:membrane protease YdiL (CAAX protease family)